MSIIGARVWAAVIGEINIVDFFILRNGGLETKGGERAAALAGWYYQFFWSCLGFFSMSLKGALML